jgi:hypothetical protein
MKKKLLQCTPLALFLIFISAYPAMAQGFYLGASVGPSFLNKALEDSQGADYSVDNSSFGYKVFTGYSISFIGLEAGYHYLGNIDGTDNGVAVESKNSGWEVAGRIHGNVGPLILFGKAGGFFSRAHNDVGAYDYRTNNSSFMWGLGAGIEFGKIMVRTEWEALDASSGNKLSSLTVGAAFHFGGDDEN